MIGHEVTDRGRSALEATTRPGRALERGLTRRIGGRIEGAARRVPASA